MDVRSIKSCEGEGGMLRPLAVIGKVRKQHHPAQRVDRTDARIANEGHSVGLFSVDQAAHFLGVSKSTFYGLVKRGEVRSVKIGRRRLISDQALRDFVLAHEEEHGQEVA